MSENFQLCKVGAREGKSWVDSQVEGGGGASVHLCCFLEFLSVESLEGVCTQSLAPCETSVIFASTLASVHRKQRDYQLERYEPVVGISAALIPLVIHCSST